MESLASASPRLALVCLFVTLCNWVHVATANVEKTIFTAPGLPPTSQVHDALSDIELFTLHPDNLAIRTNLSRAFPSNEKHLRLGQSSWFLLENLRESQVYELRVCWSALEPTSFDLETYTLDAVAQNAELLASIKHFAVSQKPGDAAAQKKISAREGNSILLVNIKAAADYFTDNRELMTHPPPVLVDIILDPYLFNVVPESLLPTVGYLIVVGIATWFAARWIASGLRSVAGPQKNDAKKNN